MTRLEQQRGVSSVCRVELEPAFWPDDVLKIPRYGTPQSLANMFGDVREHLLEDPSRSDYFPPTQLHSSTPGNLFFVQKRVHHPSGQENLAALRDESLYDKDQIQNTTDAQRILDIINIAVDFFDKTESDPSSSSGDGLGWYLEVHRPDSFMRGKIKGGSEDSIYFVDFVPVIPTTRAAAEHQFANAFRNLNTLTRRKFATDILADIEPSSPSDVIEAYQELRLAA